MLQIVNWRTHLKFPEEAKLSPEAKDLISKLLCNVEQRLGTKGADEIKVLCGVFCSKFRSSLTYWVPKIECQLNYWLIWLIISRHTRGSRALSGISCIKWKLHLFLRSMMNWILKTLRSLKRYASNSFSVSTAELPLLLLC